MHDPVREYNEAVRLTRRPYPPARERRSLIDFLTLEQRIQLRQHSWFTVIGSRGRTYRICPWSYSENITQVKRNGKTITWCASLPKAGIEENALAQKLLIESDERYFRRHANRSGVWGLLRFVFVGHWREQAR